MLTSVDTLVFLLPLVIIAINITVLSLPVPRLAGVVTDIFDVTLAVAAVEVVLI